MATRRNGGGSIVEDPPRDPATGAPQPATGAHAEPSAQTVPDAARGNGPDGFLRPPPRPAIPITLRPDGYAVLPEGNPCEGCDHCCRYVAIEIDRPTTKKDFENIRWYLLHRSISIIIDWEGAWLIQFDTPCEWLKDGRCTHYALRPEICREYDPSECERYLSTQSHKILMRTEDDLQKYLVEREVKLATRRRARAEREAEAARAAAVRKSARGAARASRTSRKAPKTRVRAASRTRGRAPSGRGSGAG